MTCALLCPLTLIESDPSALGFNCTPGNIATKEMKLRVGDGRSRISRDATLPPTRDEVRSTGGASPDTVTVS